MAILLTLLVAHDAHAVWTRSTPGAGGAFLSAAAKGDTAYVGGDLSGVYSTTNGGTSWTSRGTATGLHVSALAIKPGSAAIVLAGTDGSTPEASNSPIWYSADAGGTWTMAMQGIGSYITFIAWGPMTVWAAGALSATSGTPHLWYSSDSGVSWLPRLTLPTGSRPLKVLTHPVKDSVLYVLSGDDGFYTPDTTRLYKSSDSGQNWSRIAAGLSAIGDIAINPANGSQLFLTTGVSSGTVRRSDDAGATWTTIHSTHTGAIMVKAAGDTVRVVNIDKPSRLEPPSTPPCNECGTWDYAIGSGTWSQRNDLVESEVGWTRNAWFAYGKNARGRPKTVWVDQIDPNTLWWVTPQFVWRSTNGGWSWKNVFTSGSASEFATRGIENVAPRVFDISATLPLAGYYDLGLWKKGSNDNWVMMNDSASTSCQAGELWDGHGGNVGTLLTDNFTLWVANGSTRDHMILKRSTDFGSTWGSTTGLPSCAALITGLSMDRSSAYGNRTLYVTANGYVYKSTNDGQSWTKLEPGPYRVYVTAVDRKNGNIVYAGGRSGFWYSTNGGASWTPNLALADVDATPYGACDTSATSTDPVDVAKWCWNGVHDIVPHPNVEGTVYAAFYMDKPESTGTGGLYKSANNGLTWQQKVFAQGSAQNLPPANYIQSVALDPNRPETLYVGRSSLTQASRRLSRVRGGLYRSTDGATQNNNWTVIDVFETGLSIPCVLQAAVNSVGDVWVAVPGLGLHHSPYPGGGGNPHKYLGPPPASSGEVASGEGAGGHGEEPVAERVYYTPETAPAKGLYDIAGRRVQGRPRPGIYFTRAASGRRVVVVVRSGAE